VRQFVLSGVGWAQGGKGQGGKEQGSKGHTLASKAAKQIKSTINRAEYTCTQVSIYRHCGRHSVKVNVTAHLIARTSSTFF